MIQCERRIIMAQNAVQVYGQRNIKNGKMNIGYKSPNGKDYYNYITSLSNEEFWEDYAKGYIQKTLLFEAPADQEEIAKAVEWFALDYGTKVKKGLFYNKKNNAHKCDESKIPTKTKKIVIDFIEGRGNGLEKTKTYSRDAELVQRISENVERMTKENKFEWISIDEMRKFEHNQVRFELINNNTVKEISNRMAEQPELARKTFGPIVCVRKVDGTRCILDGNTRYEAAKKTRGWKEVPVIFINESEFGDSDLERQLNYDLFGLHENKERFEVKKPNSDEDIKRNVNNYLVSIGIDLNDSDNVEIARKMIYERFLVVVPSKQKLNGALTSILKDISKYNSELKYQSNMITYSTEFLHSYTKNKYELKDIAAVHTAASNLEHGEALAFALRHMRTLKKKKGAIVVHFRNKHEYSKAMDNEWVEDLQEVIDMFKLPVQLEVLPAFEN